MSKKQRLYETQLSDIKYKSAPSRHHLIHFLGSFELLLPGLLEASLQTHLSNAAQ